MSRTALDEALRILGRATVEDAEHARDVIRLSITLSTIKALRFELSTARSTMRRALAYLDGGDVEAARRTLANAVRLDAGPIYGGEE
jgi:Tfp pilus assembly protein PilF